MLTTWQKHTTPYFRFSPHYRHSYQWQMLVYFSFHFVYTSFNSWIWEKHVHKFYIVYTEHCDTIIIIKTNYMFSCYNLILQNFFYMFQAKQLHYQEINCRTQALWYNIMFKYIWYYDESSMCVISWSIYTAVEAILWLGQWAQYQYHNALIVQLTAWWLTFMSCNM